MELFSIKSLYYQDVENENKQADKLIIICECMNLMKKKEITKYVKSCEKIVIFMDNLLYVTPLHCTLLYFTLLYSTILRTRLYYIILTLVGILGQSDPLAHSNLDLVFGSTFFKIDALN